MFRLCVRAALLSALLVCALLRLNGFSLFYLVCFFVGTALYWRPARLQDTNGAAQQGSSSSSNAQSTAAAPQQQQRLGSPASAIVDRSSSSSGFASSQPLLQDSEGFSSPLPSTAAVSARWTLEDAAPTAEEAAARPAPARFQSTAPEPLPDRRLHPFLHFLCLSTLCILIAIAAFHIAQAAGAVDYGSNWWTAIGLQQQQPADSAGSIALLFLPDLAVFLVAASIRLLLFYQDRREAAPQQPGGSSSPAVADGVAPLSAAGRAAAASRTSIHRRRFSFFVPSGSQLVHEQPQPAATTATAAASPPARSTVRVAEPRRSQGAEQSWVWLRLDTQYTALHVVASLLLLACGIVNLCVLSLVYYVTWWLLLAVWAFTRPDATRAASSSAQSPSESPLQQPTASAYANTPSSFSISTTVSPGLSRGLSASKSLPSRQFLQPPPFSAVRDRGSSLQLVTVEEERNDDAEEARRQDNQRREENELEEEKTPAHAAGSPLHNDGLTPRESPLHSPPASSPHRQQDGSTIITTSRVLTTARLHVLYDLLSLYIACDLVVRVVFRLLFQYDSTSASLSRALFYTGVDSGLGVGLGFTYALLLVSFAWMQSIAHFHSAYVCLPAAIVSWRSASPDQSAASSLSASPHSTAAASPVLSPVYSPLLSPVASPLGSPLPSSASPCQLSTQSPPSPLPASPTAGHQFSQSRSLSARLVRIVVEYSFILLPVVAFCLSVYYDLLPAVAFLAVMTLSLLLPSPLSLLLAPLTLLMLAVFNLTLYVLYLPCAYWPLSGCSSSSSPPASGWQLVDHPWWAESVFALLSVTSAAAMYVAFVVKFRVMAFDRLRSLLIWHDLDRERREEEREARSRQAKERRRQKAALRREKEQQRRIREAERLQEEEEWQAEKQRIEQGGDHRQQQPPQLSWWRRRFSRVGRLKLRFRFSSALRSGSSSLVFGTLALCRAVYLNADLLAIILLYVIGVVSTDVLHAVSILLFIVYAISHRARRSPAILVCYSCVAIIILFVFQYFPLSLDADGAWEQRAGFIGFGSGYAQLWPFIGLLVFGSIFYHLNPYKKRRTTGEKGAEVDDDELQQRRSVHESVVVVGLAVCEAMMLWAACVNSLQSLTSLSISIISGVYFLLAFLLLLNHQLASSSSSSSSLYMRDALILYVTASYAGCVVVVLYLYQLHAFDSYSSWLEYAGLARGETWRVLLTHCVVLFVCSFQLRVMQRLIVNTTLLSHVRHRHQHYAALTSSAALRSLLHLAFLLFLFVYWILMLHTDKFLVITLFLAATRYVSVMGAWYILCALCVLLVPGLVKLKSTVVMLSGLLFTLATFAAQMPLAAFGEEASVFALLGLRVNTEDFGVLVVGHIAVVLMARFYCTSYHWHRQWMAEQGRLQEALTDTPSVPSSLSVAAAPSPAAPPAVLTIDGLHVDPASLRPVLPPRAVRVDEWTTVRQQLVRMQLQQLQLQTAAQTQQEKTAADHETARQHEHHVIDLLTSATQPSLQPDADSAPDAQQPLPSAESDAAPAAAAGSADKQPADAAAAAPPPPRPHGTLVTRFCRAAFLDPSSVLRYCLHLSHYFSFYHLTLIACLIAAYDNASTVFGLGFTVLAGVIVVLGEQRVNAFWLWLLAASVLEVTVKYALSVVNLWPGRSCQPSCSSWEQYWAHDDHLHDWDVVVLLCLAVHYAQMQQIRYRAIVDKVRDAERRKRQRQLQGRQAAAAADDEEEDSEEQRQLYEKDREQWRLLRRPPAVEPEEEELRRQLYVPCPPHSLTVSYYSYDSTRESYLVHDFTRRLGSSAAVCHFLVFRCLLYLTLFLLLSVSSCFFNVISTIYLACELCLLCMGDSLLSRPERARLLLYFSYLLYAVYLLRFLYLIPVFPVNNSAAAWSTVLGFYHVQGEAVPADDVSGVVGGVLVMDIIMMVLLTVQLTLLQRPEMEFVRCHLARNRLVAELRRAKEERRRTAEREAVRLRLAEEQAERVTRLHHVLAIRRASLLANPAFDAVKPVSPLVAGHRWTQSLAPVGSRGGVNAPLETAGPSPTLGSPAAVAPVLPPSPNVAIRPADATARVEAAKGSPEEEARGLGAAYTVAAITAHQRVRAALERCGPPQTVAASAASLAAMPLRLEERQSRYGPPRLLLPPSLLQEQWQRIQRHERIPGHRLARSVFARRLWLWWRLTNNTAVDWLSSGLGINRDERKRRDDAMRRSRRQRERSRLQAEQRAAAEAAAAAAHGAPLVHVNILPDLLVPDRVHVTIASGSAASLPSVFSFSVSSSKQTTHSASAAAAPLAEGQTARAASAGEESDQDDPVLRQRARDLRVAPSLVVQLLQLWRCVFESWSLLWLCVLFFAEYLSQPSLLSLLYPVSLFCFALIVNPRPPTAYWRCVLLYTCAVITARFVFQYPVFALCAPLTVAPYYTTQAELTDPYCNAVVSYSSDGALAQDLAGVVKVTSRGEAESGWLWTFMSQTAVDWLTLFALLLHRRKLKDAGLWDAPRLLTDSERQKQHEEQRRRLQAEKRRRRQRRQKEREKQRQARERQRVQEQRERSRKSLRLARLLRQKDMTDSERGQASRLQAELLSAGLRQRKRRHGAATDSGEETKDIADQKGTKLNISSPQELAHALRRQEKERARLQAEEEEKRDADAAGADDSDTDAELEGNTAHATIVLSKHDAEGGQTQRLHISPTDPDGPPSQRHHSKRQHEPSSAAAQRAGRAEDEEEEDSPSFLLQLYRRLTDTSSKTGRDLYIAIFLVQVVLFFVVLIFYNLQSSIYTQVTDNYIPLRFVLIIFSIFMLIVVERIVYLYQSLLCKLCLQLATLLTFFVIAEVLGLDYSALLEIVYVIFSVYWLLSAQQFYYGYPLNTHGQYLMRSTHWAFSTMLTVYRALPFLFELRTLLDWSCTLTVLSFSDWLVLEDIVANFYSVQCAADSLRSSPTTEGHKVSRRNKWLIGVSLFAALVLLLFGPLFLFSSQAATSANPVTAFSLEVELSGFSPVFSSDQFTALALSDAQFQTLVNQDSALLSSQSQSTLQALYSLNTGNSVWQSTPDARSRLLQALAAGEQLLLSFTFTFVRAAATSFPVLYYVSTAAVPANETQLLAAAINSSSTTAVSLIIPACYPRYFSLSATADDITDSVTPLSLAAIDLNTCELIFHPAASAAAPAWWQLLDASNSSLTLGEDPTLDAPPVFAFSQRLPSSSSLNLGLVAVYVTIVLAIGKFLRVYVQGNSANIIYQQVPDPSPVLTLCKDLYSARLLRQLVLEEQLFVELINLLRSPEQLLLRTGEFYHFYPASMQDHDSDDEQQEAEINSGRAQQQAQQPAQQPQHQPEQRESEERKQEAETREQEEQRQRQQQQQLDDSAAVRGWDL